MISFIKRKNQTHVSLCKKSNYFLLFVFGHFRFGLCGNNPFLSQPQVAVCATASFSGGQIKASLIFSPGG